MRRRIRFHPSHGQQEASAEKWNWQDLGTMGVSSVGQGSVLRLGRPVTKMGAFSQNRPMKTGAVVGLRRGHAVIQLPEAF